VKGHRFQMFKESQDENQNVFTAGKLSGLFCDSLGLKWFNSYALGASCACK